MAGPPGTSISLTEAQGFAALGQFLQAICSPSPIPIVRQVGSTRPGDNVRVPAPRDADFVVMSSQRYERLETNETTFSDNICVASIVGTVMTVTDVSRGSLLPGQLLVDYNYPSGSIAPNTTIFSQLSSSEEDGHLGGAGAYRVTVSQTLAAETLYSGTRSDRVGTEWVAQLDVHGPNSANNVRVIDTLFRSEYGVDFFSDTGLWVAPLYADVAGQIPFDNAESEVEYRWVVEAHLEVVPIVVTPQQFADHVQVALVEVPPGAAPIVPPPFPPAPPPPSTDMTVRIELPSPSTYDGWLTSLGGFNYSLAAGTLPNLAISISDTEGTFVGTRVFGAFDVGGSILFNQPYQSYTMYWNGSVWVLV